MEEKIIGEIEARIADLKARWPAHSVPPHMWQQLEELEEQLEAARKFKEGIFDTGHTNKLDNEGRLKELRPRALLEQAAGLTPGMTGVDLGCGTGVFAFPMAELVGKTGKVYAVDNSAAMLEHIRAKNPPPQMVLTESDVLQTGLRGGIADICLLAFILHELKQPEKLAAEAARLLKPGGKAVIVEWKAGMDRPGPPAGKRISREHLKELLAPAGLILTGYESWSANHYVATAEK